MKNSLYISIAHSFEKELEQAEKGKKTSLPFIRHQYSTNRIVADGEKFEVFVVGGSVFKAAQMKRQGKRLTLLDKHEAMQPIFKTEEDFLSFVASHVDPKVRVLALNMAYPLTPQFESGKLEGVLAFATKEHSFTGLIGKPVGKTIEEYLFRTRGQKLTVAIANDTICLLLSGLTRYRWDQVAAGIVGTGMNFAIFLDENTLVNLEAANFDKFEATPEGKLVDKHSSVPGMARSEKEVAGAYLYQVYNEGAKLRGITGEALTSTDQIDDVAKNGNGHTDAAQYAQEILTRSAGLVASQIAGITNFLGRDSAFVMEGSLFWKGYHYKEHVEGFVAELVPKHTVEYIYLPDSGIMGAAKLVA